ncbi:MAG: hypothetical protein K0B81_01900 [Candidatus Cloacimonetes bacterium]|nr:hypothetical protein [Candidatus Cloacimonadota bacterium]
MKHIITILIISVVFLTTLNAVFDDYEPSVRARGLGGAFYSLSDDATGIFYNPAGLIKSPGHFTGSYTRIFSNDFQVLMTSAFTMPLPKRAGSIGIGFQSMDVQYLDVNMMSEKVINLGHSFTLMRDVHSEFHLGYSGSLYVLDIDRFGSETTFGLNLGALVILHHRTRLGFAIDNINNPRIGVNNKHEIPQRLAMGITYNPYPGVTTSLDLKKPFGEPTQIHTGAEVEVHPVLTLRAGLRNHPASFSCGASFVVHDFLVDYALNTHSVLRTTHHFGIGYRF